MKLAEGSIIVAVVHFMNIAYSLSSASNANSSEIIRIIRSSWWFWPQVNSTTSAPTTTATSTTTTTTTTTPKPYYKFYRPPSGYSIWGQNPQAEFLYGLFPPAAAAAPYQANPLGHYLFPGNPSYQFPNPYQPGVAPNFPQNPYPYYPTTVSQSTTTASSSTTQRTNTTNCTCVPYYLCNEGDVVVDGTGVIDIRSKPPQCKYVLEVCCRAPMTTPSTTPESTTPAIYRRSGCGYGNPNGAHTRILGFRDSETQFGEYPWMAAILESQRLGTQNGLLYVCGASLINTQVALTAAHCVRGKTPSTLTVRLGEWDAATTMEFYGHQDVQVLQVLEHPNYYGGGLYNDVALLLLERNVTLDNHIGTVCLPGQTGTPDPWSCVATGWGKNAFSADSPYQPILKKVALPIIPRDACQRALRRTRLGAGFNLHSSALCAGGQRGQDTCVGDGGGPLVCATIEDPHRFVQVGIVSWGIGCGMYGVPGVYANVSMFTAWINQNIPLLLTNGTTTSTTTSTSTTTTTTTRRPYYGAYPLTYG